MAYFVIQVKTGFELHVKEMLKQTLSTAELKNVTVKSIYATETLTFLSNEIDFEINSSLNDQDITDYLHIKRLQTGLNHMRVACDNLKTYTDQDFIDLTDSYRGEIRELTSQLKEARLHAKQVSSVLKGYILLEVAEDFTRIDDELWHLVKSIPNVTGFPSLYNVPTEEIEYFFEHLDVSPIVDTCIGEVQENSEEEIIKKRNALIIQMNQFIGTKREKDLIQTYNLVIKSLSEARAMKEIEGTITSVFEKALKKYAVFKGTLVRCCVSRQRNRINISLPLNLWKPMKDKLNDALCSIVNKKSYFTTKLESLLEGGLV